MDKREMKRDLRFYMIERMQMNLANQFGERPQKIFLEELIPKRIIGNREFSGVTPAHERRLRKLIDDMYRTELTKKKNREW